MPTNSPILHSLDDLRAEIASILAKGSTRATERTDPSRPNAGIRPEKPTNLRWLWGKDLMFRPGETFIRDTS